MERQIITVDISPQKGIIPRLKVSQGDIGRPLGVNIIQDGVALDCSAYTADLYVLKSDGNYFVSTVTVDSTETNLIKWNTAEQETIVSGECAAQIRITHGEEDIGTARFVEYVEASPGFNGAGSESAVESIKEYVRQAAASAETASSAATSASTSATTATGAASAAASSASAAAGSASSAHRDAETASQAAQTAQDVADSIPEDYSTLSEDVTGLKSAFEQLDANVITESAGPSHIVSIADGANGMPMRKVEVAIEPVQDLHGYEYPWPAGGGKNILDPSLLIDQVSWFVIPLNVKPNTQYTCSTNKGTATDTNLYLYFNNTGAAGGGTSTAVYAGNPTTVDSTEAGIVYITGRRSDGTDSFANYIVQVEESSTATELTPYSNICPITGWTGAKVTRTGKNLWKNEYPDISGSSRVTYYPVYVGNNPVTVSTDAPGNSADIANLFALPGNVNTGANSNMNGVKNDTPRTVTPIDGYITIGARNYNSLDPREYHTQVEIGTATSYEPYQGRTYEVTFPTETGTVYGGTLDVVSGKLVVDRAILETTWAGGSATEYDDRTRKRWTLNPRQDSTQDATAVCNLATYQMATAPPINRFSFNPTQPYFYLSLAKDTDGATPIQVCYRIATPQEITLSPTEITTLLGINQVFADCGDLSIAYPADTKMYIDNRINSTRKLIAGIETGFVASKAYAVGDMLIIGDDLYKVASSISSGATITVGTNVTKTTVAEQLIALANA